MDCRRLARRRCLARRPTARGSARTPEQLIRFLDQGHHARPRHGGTRAFQRAMVCGQPLDLLLVECAGDCSREPLKPYRVRAEAGAVPESLSVAQMDSAGPLAAIGNVSRDNSLRTAAWNDDIFVVSLRTGALRRLTNTVAKESDPHSTVARSTSSSFATTMRSPSTSPPVRRNSSRTYAPAPSRKRKRSRRDSAPRSRRSSGSYLAP